VVPAWARPSERPAPRASAPGDPPAPREAAGLAVVASRLDPHPYHSTGAHGTRGLEIPAFSCPVVATAVVRPGWAAGGLSRGRSPRGWRRRASAAHGVGRGMPRPGAPEAACVVARRLGTPLRLSRTASSSIGRFDHAERRRAGRLAVRCRRHARPACGGVCAGWDDDSTVRGVALSMGHKARASEFESRSCARPPTRGPVRAFGGRSPRRPHRRCVVERPAARGILRAFLDGNCDP